MRILAYCAVNAARRFPQAEAQILQLEGVAQTVFDFEEDPALPWYENVLRKYQRARGMTLAGGFDALLTAESDMLIPNDAALQLAALDAPVAYGLYCLRHGAPVWNACVALDEEAGFFLTDPLARENAPNEWHAALAGLPFQCYGAGFGCTLIARDVLKELEFRNLAQPSFYTDWLFAADCNRLGLRQVCDPRVVCGHISESRMVLYPDITRDALYRSEYLTGG